MDSFTPIHQYSSFKQIMRLQGALSMVLSTNGFNTVHTAVSAALIGAHNFVQMEYVA